MPGKTHGLSNRGRSPHPLYQTWVAMKNRCLNPRNYAWKWYGARGISVCDRWCASFLDFIEDVGERPSPKHSIDRINNNGNYEPSNVRWATPAEQIQNRRPYERARGESHVLTRLSTAEVMKIRELCARGEKQRDVARMYRTTQANVSLIVRLESRKRG
jgi:hypothetical protein